MPDGGCFCGNVRFSYSGEPLGKALCHCVDCRKTSGSTYSTNIFVATDGLKVTKGTPKTISKTADSGKTITSHFCGDCGSTLFRTCESFGPNTVIKVGMMDDLDALNQAKPGIELFVGRRVNWVPEAPGAAQKSAMP